MDLGWCDVCLRVASAKASRAFYEKIGFVLVEGDDEEGWAVVTNGGQRLGLYEARHMGDDAVTLNFRGGNVPQIVRELEKNGIKFHDDSRQHKSEWSRTLRDPDGYNLFFDTAEGEGARKKQVATED